MTQTVAITAPGSPIESADLTGTPLDWVFTLASRRSAIVQFIADDDTLGWQWGLSSSGPFSRVPPGGLLNWPVDSPSRTIWVVEDTAPVTVRATAVG